MSILWSRFTALNAVIAAAVAEVAYEEKLARKKRPQDLLASIKSQMFVPNYPSYA